MDISASTILATLALVLMVTMTGGSLISPLLSGAIVVGKVKKAEVVSLHFQFDFQKAGQSC